MLSAYALSGAPLADTGVRDVVTTADGVALSVTPGDVASVVRVSALGSVTRSSAGVTQAGVTAHADGAACAYSGATVNPSLSAPCVSAQLSVTRGELAFASALTVSGAAVTTTTGTLAAAFTARVNGQAYAVSAGVTQSSLAASAVGAAVAVLGGAVNPTHLATVVGAALSTATGETAAAMRALATGRRIRVTPGSVYLVAGTVTVTGTRLGVASGTASARYRAAAVGARVLIRPGAIIVNPSPAGPLRFRARLRYAVAAFSSDALDAEIESVRILAHANASAVASGLRSAGAGGIITTIDTDVKARYPRASSRPQHKGATVQWRRD